MRISTRIDGSIYGAILSCRPSPSLSPALSLYTARVHDGHRGVISDGLFAVYDHHPPGWLKKTPKISCASISTRRFSSSVATAHPRPSGSGYFDSNLHCTRRWNHAAASTADTPLPSQPVMPQDELLDIIDRYDGTSVEEHLEYLRDPYLRRYAPADGPNLTVSDKAEDENLQSVGNARGTNPERDEIIRKLEEVIHLKLRRPAMIDSDKIYDHYLSLPEPRMPLITARTRHRLLAALGMTERKDPKSMLRYFSVITDVKNSGFPLTRSEWNTAMSFASRYVGRSTEVEVEAALHLWREMEHDAGIRGSDVTFNILFDVASKAGKLALAEMIYQEMGTRGFSFNRYHHVSLIHYFGLKQDSSGMRAAYKEMVESGEIIDSTVLNCMISGFLTCGEQESAEKVYEKMKLSAQRENKQIPFCDYTLQKNITKVLMMFAKIGREYPDMRQNFQQSALIAPNLQTYRLLINYFGPRMGNISRVAQLLDEMKFFNIPLHGAIFLALFKGFGRHGAPGSDWSAQRLDSVWNAFLDVIEAKAEGLYISTWMAMAILRAFSKFLSRTELLDIYESLRIRWTLDPVGEQFMMDYLQKTIQKSGRLKHFKGVPL